LLPVENAIEFSNRVKAIQNQYIVEKDTRTCFDKINPFVQMKWAQKEYSYTAKTEENPYYFYSGAKTI
jgi:hypothetical protein